MICCSDCGRDLRSLEPGCPTCFDPTTKLIQELKEKCRQQQLEIDSFAGRRSRQQEEIARLHRELEARRAVDAWCRGTSSESHNLLKRHIQIYGDEFYAIEEWEDTGLHAGVVAVERSYVEIAEALGLIGTQRDADAGMDSCGDCPGCGIPSNDECPPVKP